MTVINAPPVAVAPSSDPTADKSFQVSIPAGAPQQVSWALVVNQSAYTVEVSQGSSPMGWLPAGISNAYPLGSVGTPVTLTVPAGTAAAPTGLAPQLVYVTYSDTQPPGQWPAGINTAQLAASIAGSVALSVFNIGSFAYVVSPPNTTQRLTIPANTHTIRVFASESGSSTTFSMQAVGVQSGLSYPVVLSAGGTFSNNAIATIPFGGTGIDTQIDFTVSGATGAGTVWVVGTSDPALVPVEVTKNVNVWTTPFSGITAFASAQVGAGGSATLLTIPNGATWALNNLSLSLIGSSGQGNVAIGGSQLIGHFSPCAVEKQFEGGEGFTGPQTLTLSTTAGIQGLAIVHYSQIIARS